MRACYVVHVRCDNETALAPILTASLAYERTKRQFISGTNFCLPVLDQVRKVIGINESLQCHVNDKQRQEVSESCQELWNTVMPIKHSTDRRLFQNLHLNLPNSFVTTTSVTTCFNNTQCSIERWQSHLDRQNSFVAVVVVCVKTLAVVAAVARELWAPALTTFNFPPKKRAIVRQQQRLFHMWQHATTHIVNTYSYTGLTSASRSIDQFVCVLCIYERRRGILPTIYRRPSASAAWAQILQLHFGCSPLLASQFLVSAYYLVSHTHNWRLWGRYYCDLYLNSTDFLHQPAKRIKKLWPGLVDCQAISYMGTLRHEWRITLQLDMTNGRNRTQVQWKNDVHSTVINCQHKILVDSDCWTTLRRNVCRLPQRIVNHDAKWFQMTFWQAAIF